MKQSLAYFAGTVIGLIIAVPIMVIWKPGLTPTEAETHAMATRDVNALPFAKLPSVESLTGRISSGYSEMSLECPQKIGAQHASISYRLLVRDPQSKNALRDLNGKWITIEAVVAESGWNLYAVVLNVKEASQEN